MNSSSTPASKLPTHYAFSVREIKPGDSIWTRIGSAWAHSDGQGLNIQLESLPVDGRLTLRVPTGKGD